MGDYSSQVTLTLPGRALAFPHFDQTPISKGPQQKQQYQNQYQHSSLTIYSLDCCSWWLVQESGSGRLMFHQQAKLLSLETEQQRVNCISRLGVLFGQEVQSLVLEKE